VLDVKVFLVILNIYKTFGILSITMSITHVQCSAPNG